ncbi:hypothetical protein [Streptomyces sp. AA1529]|uniref:hypothetical protein n=1 Tax=Streptomyces sp. AA1529 TaxID=1203257 RepID=UPI003D7060D7
MTLSTSVSSRGPAMQFLFDLKPPCRPPLVRWQVSDALSVFVKDKTVLPCNKDFPVGVPAAVQQNLPCRKAAFS